MLEFTPVIPADIPLLRPWLTAHPFRSCDFSVGGIFLWADYFHYQKAIKGDTLFIKGVTENDMSRPAFSLPLGPMPIAESLALLRRHCDAEGVDLVMSAVPQEALQVLMDNGARRFTELTDWADYVYDIKALSTFAGKKLSKKRNHINRFALDHPDAVFSPVTAADAPELIEFYERLHTDADTSEIAAYDRAQTLRVLRSPDFYGFDGGVLRVPGRGIVAFAMGEPVGDTLMTHIEKMDHEVTGAGETICRDFTAMMAARHPDLNYVNREDDSGDPGLRQAKEALHPLFMQRKYNVAF